MIKKGALGMNESGHGLLEMVVVFPLVLLVGLVGLEYSLSFQEFQQITTISRELASQSYRECSEKRNDATSQRMYADYCFEDTIDSVRRSFGSTATGAVLIVSLYTWDGAAVHEEALVGEATGFSSKFSSTALSATSNMGKALRKNNLLVIAEVYRPHVPLVKGIASLTSFAVGNFYDATAI